jgi:hypothetical protein
MEKTMAEIMQAAAAATALLNGSAQVTLSAVAPAVTESPVVVDPAAPVVQPKTEALTEAKAPVVPAVDQGLQALVVQITDTALKNAKLEAELSQSHIACAAMATIVGASLSRMSVSLGGSAVDVTAMTPGALVAAHTAEAAKFSAKFPTGGIAPVAIDPATETSAQAPMSEGDLAMHMRRVNATKSNH